MIPFPAKPKREERPSIQPSFKGGEKVKHAKFGTGRIVSSRIVNGDEELQVAFDQHGIKKLMASFANLERV